MLSSPALTVLVNVIVATPPQHARGKAVPGLETSTGIVACNKDLLTTVMFFKGTTRSGTASPLESQPSVIEVGVNPHPIKSSVTSQSAFMIPTLDCTGTSG